MNNIKLNICKVNQTQRDDVLKIFPRMSILDRENSIIYVAVNETDNIIGRIVVTEKDVPAPIGGKYWFIMNIFVHSEYRRRGIATKLVDEIKRQAKMRNIIYLYGSANASLEASMFWLNQGFTLNACGKKENDPSNPLLYGNYHHLFSYCIQRKSLNERENFDRIRIATKDEIFYLIDKYTLDEKLKTNYLLRKSDDLFGFVSIGENNETQGVIIAFADSMQAPFDSIRWFIFLYVDPRFRHKGIGRSLVCQLYRYAQEKEVVQLTNFDTTEDNIGFWFELGFDIFFWAENTQTGKRSTTAMVRVK